MVGGLRRSGPVRRARVLEIARTGLPIRRERSTTRRVGLRHRQLAALAGQRPRALQGQHTIGGIADVGLDHGGVDPHRPGSKAGFPLGLADHHPGQFGDDLGARAGGPACCTVDSSGTRWVSGSRQNRRRCSESDTSRIRVA